ncbi:MAG TPA: M48 family metallopeptidase [Actinomycetota bacterium]|nr:M48 family metallopeptidase [Actinomycetota bacterium]
MYEQIARNKWRSVALVLGVLVLAAGIGYLFGYLFEAGPVGLVLALVIAVIGSWSSYLYGDKLVLRVSRARPASREQYPKLHNIVEGLCIAAGMPVPAIYVIPEQAPNAFATGRNPEHASIAVTEGLLETLNRVELEGVIAHELSHVKNRDVLVGTLTATLVGVVVLLAGWMRWGLFWGGGRGRDRGGGGGGNAIFLVLALVAMILAPLAAQLIRFAVSRRREYLADADGALLTRYPPGLAAALRKIAGSTNTMRVANDATAHLWFSQPSRAVGEGYSRVERLFSTHPPIEDRIRALEEM